MARCQLCHIFWVKIRSWCALVLFCFHDSSNVFTPQASKDTHLTLNKPTNTNTSFLGFSKTVVCGLFLFVFVFLKVSTLNKLRL